MITLIIRNSLIKRLSNFHAVFSNSGKRRYVVEEKLRQSKVKSEKFLLLNITTLENFILFSSTCSVQLICQMKFWYPSTSSKKPNLNGARQVINIVASCRETKFPERYWG